MLGELVRGSQQIARKAVDRSLFDWAGLLHLSGEKVDVELAAQVPPGGAVGFKANGVLHSDPWTVGQNATEKKVVYLTYNFRRATDGGLGNVLNQ